MAKAAGWLKLLGALALTAVLGAGAALVALRTLFPEPKLRAMVEDGARKQLGREVKLEHISLGLRGLSLDGLQVSESPDFTAGTFVSVEHFRLRPSWRALLEKKLVVATVVADGLKLAVVKTGEGRFNFSNLAASTSAASAPSAPSSGEKPEFSIRHVRVSRGEVLYKDEPGRQQWSLTELGLAVDDFSLLAPFDADLSVRVKGDASGRPVDAKLGFSGRIDPARGDAAKLKVKADLLSVEAEGLALKGKADIEGLSPPKASFDARLSASGKELLQAEGEIRLSSAAGGDFLADVKAESSGLDTTLLAKWLPAGTIPAVNLPSSKLTLKAERRGESLQVKSLALIWDGGTADGHVSAKGLGTPAPAYDGKLVLDLVLPALAKGQYPFLKLPPDLSLPSSKVQGTLQLSGDGARFEGFTVTIPQGSVTVNGSVAKLGSAKPVPDLDAVIELDLPSVKAGDLPAKLPPSVPPSFVIPAVKVDGGVAVKGEDVRFKDLKLGFSGGKVIVGGAALGALGAKLRPELEVQASLALPALTDKDLPFPGIPAGLKLPATNWETDLDYTLERLRIRSLRVKLGTNDIAVEGTVGDPAGRVAYDLLVKARPLLFSELTQLTPATRELELKGSAFAAFSVTGTGEKPVFAGKAQFKDAGATVAGIPLSEFGGTVSFDKDSVEVPNVKGKVADGQLAADLTVSRWATAPDILFDAKLDRFDLGRFLDAKKRYVAEHPPKAAPAGKPGAASAPPPGLRSKGSFEVGALAHPQATVSAVKLAWDLTGIGPDMRPLNGTVRLSTAEGRLRSAKEMASQNPALKVLLLPLTIIQGLGRLGGIPDLSDIVVHAVAGDYVIQNGVMHVRDSRLESDKVQASATGSVDLPHEALDLLVIAQVDGKLGRSAPIEIPVKGTISDPKAKPKVAKFIGETLLNLIPKQKAAQPAGE